MVDGKLWELEAGGSNPLTQTMQTGGWHLRQSHTLF